MTSPFQPGASLVAYLRDSGGRDQDLSLEQQEKELRAWCTEHGHSLSQIYKDEATPGSSIVGRDGFLNMMHDLKQGEGDIAGLVLWKYNRFARDFDDAQFFKADLRRRGYTIHSLNDNVPDGPDGRLFEAAIDWMNQRFVEDIRKDVQRGLHNLVLSHGCLPGPVARGFKKEPVIIGKRRNGQDHVAHRWVIDPDTAPIVRRAFELKAAGATRKHIHAQTGLYKSMSGYNPMFRNSIYFGKLDWGKGDRRIIVDDFIEPIVPKELWESVQRVLDRNRQKSNGDDPNHPRRKSSPLLLSGLAYCANCRTALSAVSTQRPGEKRYFYYRCSAHTVPERGCTHTRVPKEVLEEAVIKQLTEHILAPENAQRLAGEVLEAQQQPKIDTTALEKERIAVKSQIDNLVDAIAESGQNPALLSKLDQLTDQYEELGQDVRAAQTQNGVGELTMDELVKSTSELAAKLKAGDPEQVRLILRGLIKRIEVRRTEDKIEGQIFFLTPIEAFILSQQSPL